MKIIVLKQDKPLGYLTESTFDKVTFEYFEDVIKERYLTGLKDSINYSTNGLFQIFKNLLPENNQIDILKAQLKISSNIELLLHLEDIHGSYSFLTEEQFSKSKLKVENVLYQYNDVENDILQNNYNFPNILDYKLNIAQDKLFPDNIVSSKVIGLSGFQYKFSIIKDDKNKQLIVDPTKLSEYFIKPFSIYNTTYKPHDKDRSYIPYLLINEHLFMSIARDIGFKVPYNAIIKDGKDYHYIIKRFDRYNGVKFDHEEFATLLGYDSDTKYDPTLIQILKEASEHVGIDSIEEILLFFFFSTVISHGDLHSKNISLIHASNNVEEQKRLLSPYYDISTTNIYKGLKDRDVGLKIKNKKIKIRKKDFIDIAKMFKIDEVAFEEKMKGIVLYFLDNFLNYVDKLGEDILSLPYYYGGYGSQKSFSAILQKYYTQRKDYVRKYIDNDWVVEDNIFS
ncbi:MAG: hypothetical protein DRG78_11425 [Epsilonproteobacteria bacterium]|nr:MAG: hypothetical protein DRG78_11425 [Campylobacterota bacterium]